MSGWKTHCKGSGVPGDPVSDGHPVVDPIVWQTPEDNGSGNVFVPTRCRLCEQTRRDHHKNRNRPAVKARSTMSSHAMRYGKKWKMKTAEARERLIQQWGWNPHTIEAKFRAAIEDGSCDHCGWEWDFGEHEMTLDVNDPARPRIEDTSVMCRSCNSTKKSMDLIDFNRMQDEKRRIIAYGASNPPLTLPFP